VHLCLGDALVFAGRDHAHLGEPLPAGQFSTLLLLHYVDADIDANTEGPPG
jgi:hypothetical protein